MTVSFAKQLITCWVSSCDIYLEFDINVYFSAPPPFYCPRDEWECPGDFRQCINKTHVCDGFPDCPGGNDESPLCSKYEIEQW